jgi:hypothetical protein
MYYYNLLYSHMCIYIYIHMTTVMIHHGNPHEPVSNPGKAIARMPKIQRQLQLLDATRHFETFRQKARMQSDCEHSPSSRRKGDGLLMG